MLLVSSVFVFLSLQERLVGKTRNGEDRMKTLGQIFVSMVQRSITLMSWSRMHLNLAGGRAHILMQSSLIVSKFLYKSRNRIGEGNGTPLQYSCLENPMDRGAWRAVVHGVTKSRAQLSDFTFTFHFQAVEKEMATHFSVVAWRIPGTGEPGGLLSMGSHRVRHD